MDEKISYATHDIRPVLQRSKQLNISYITQDEAVSDRQPPRLSAETDVRGCFLGETKPVYPSRGKGNTAVKNRDRLEFRVLVLRTARVGLCPKDGGCVPFCSPQPSETMHSKTGGSERKEGNPISIDVDARG